jgi:two-component system phosphate regulon sensor histidine kinase PhoR
MHWVNAALRIVFLLAVGTALGWYFGHPIEFAALTLFGVLAFWCYQMWQLQQWLSSPEQTPPDLPGVWGDIVSTVYKRQREASQNNDRLQALVDYLLDSFSSMRDGVVIVERSGGIRWCNEVATRLLGLHYPRDTGQAITNLVRQPEFTRYVQAGDYEEPLLFYPDSGRQVFLQVLITRFGEGDSLIFVRDITERARMEQVRRDFVANVSHELRTPLTVITGYVETFLSAADQLPASFIKPLEQMSQQSVRMENLLKDLLWLSRIESEEKEEKREQVDISALVQELRDEMSNTHPERRLVLRITAREKITGDYRELYSAVSNLVQNAVKYSPADTPVTVAWRVGEGGLHLSVTDLGIGIDQAHIPRLTERFYRVDDSRSSTTGGTGLGLAIVKHVAAAHGAHLKIESELGTGSTFTLVFRRDNGRIPPETS